MEVISSRNNPIVKEVRSLKEKKYRDKRGLFFIEGLRFAEEAFKSGAYVTALLLSDRIMGSPAAEKLLSEAKEKETKICWVKDGLFNELSDTETPQGIMAVVRNRSYSLEDIFMGKNASESEASVNGNANETIGDNTVIVILDSVQDPGNMGTIIRTADAAGINGIIASKGCVDPYNPKVLRSTMGSIFHVPLCHGIDMGDALRMAKAKGMKIFASHLEGKIYHFEADFKGSLAIVIGNEASGISRDAFLAADVLVKIPMLGKAESLNASVAAGILMYEAVRQRFH